MQRPICTWVPPGLSGEQIVCVLQQFYDKPAGMNPLTLETNTSVLFIGYALKNRVLVKMLRNHSI